MLQDRLRLINEDLARLLASRNEYDSTIQESEAAYMKARDSPAQRAARSLARSLRRAIGPATRIHRCGASFSRRSWSPPKPC